jgi:LmbE family N-acetylglucosaminyl deacetylase
MRKGFGVAAEEEWLAALRQIPKWVAPGSPVVILAPHPDDEILGAGGYLAACARQNLSITVVAATDGEAAYADFEDLAGIRRREQEAALAAVGVDSTQIHRLGLPDGKVSMYEAELYRRLIPLLDEQTVLLTPWQKEPHPDHEACGRAAIRAAAATRTQLVSYFFWAWHHCATAQILELNPHRFELDDQLCQVKARALGEYRSQLEHEPGNPILPDALLAPARRSFETFVIHAA